MASNAILDDVATTLAGGGLSLTLATNLFASILPDTPDQAVSLVEYPDVEPEFTQGAGTLPAIESVRIQILSRDVEANYAANQTRIQNIYRFCLQQTNVTIGGTNYLRWTPLHYPTFMHRDEKRRIHHVLNISVERTPV